MAKSTGDDHIGAERVRFRLKPVSDRAMGNIFDTDGVHRGAMHPKMLDHLLTGRALAGVDKARRIDHEDGGPLGALDQRQGVVKRSGRGSARVPGYGDVAAQLLE